MKTNKDCKRENNEKLAETVETVETEKTISPASPVSPASPKGKDKQKFTRSTPLAKIYSLKYKDLILDGDWKIVLGVPELGGIWLIWGNEKNGKTWHSLKLAEHLSENHKVLYISAEQGIRKSFKEACLGLIESIRVPFWRNIFFPPSGLFLPDHG